MVLRATFAHYRASFGGLPAITWLLCVAGFVNRAGAMVVPFLSLWLGQKFGYSVGEAGRVISCYGVGAVLGSMVGGKLADLLGPVRVQIVTLGSTCLWMLLMTQLERPLLLVPAVFVLGVLNDAFRPGNITAVGGSCEPALRRRALSLNRLALNAGWAIGPTVGGHLADVDFRWLFVADGTTCGLAALFLWIVLRDWRPTLEARDANDARSGRPLADRHFVVLLAFTFCYLFAFLQYFSTGSRWLEHEFGYDKSTIGWFLAINPIVIVLFEMPAVHALRGRAALPIVALGCVVTAIGFVLFVPSRGAVTISIAMATIAIGEILQMPLLGAHVNDHAPAHARGAYNGAYAGMFSLGMVLAPWLGGELYDAAGPDSLWWTCGGLGLVAAFGFWSLHRRGRG